MASATTTTTSTTIAPFGGSTADKEANNKNEQSTRTELEKEAQKRYDKLLRLSQKTNPFSFALGNQSRNGFRFTNGNATYRAGAFPSYFPEAIAEGGGQSVSEKIATYVNRMSWSEKLTLKKRLWAAGFYAVAAKQAQIATWAEEKYTPNKTDEARNEDSSIISPAPTSGEWTVSDEQVLQYALVTYETEQAKGFESRSFDEFLGRQIVDFSNKRQMTIDKLFDLDSMSNALQEYSMKAIGRALNDEELNGIYTRVFNYQGTKTTGAGEQEQATRILFGGGLDSSALQYAREIGNAYGLVTSANFDPTKTPQVEQVWPGAVSDGRAVTFYGDATSLARFTSWAKENMGENGIFDFVSEYNAGGEPGQQLGVRVAIREGAVVPDMGFAASPANTVNDFARFLGAVREPMGAGGYQWERGEPSRYGAYSLDDSTWRYYANKFAIDPEDHSADTQDKVASAYVSDLYEKYRGDWRMIALAFTGSQQTADLVRAQTSMDTSGTYDFLPSQFASLPEYKAANDLLGRMGRYQASSISTKDAYQSVYGRGSSAFNMSELGGMPMSDAEAKAKQEKVFRDAMKFEIAGAQIFSRLSDTVINTMLDKKIAEKRAK